MLMLLNMGITVESAVRSYENGESAVPILKEIYSHRIRDAANKVITTYEEILADYFNSGRSNLV